MNKEEVLKVALKRAIRDLYFREGEDFIFAISLEEYEAATFKMYVEDAMKELSKGDSNEQS